MRGIDVPEIEIERARSFLATIRKDRIAIADEEIIGPHMMKTTYRDLLRLMAWYHLTCPRENGTGQFQKKGGG